jgi:hypothetical protein
MDSVVHLLQASASSGITAAHLANGKPAERVFEVESGKPNVQKLFGVPGPNGHIIVIVCNSII